MNTNVHFERFLGSSIVACLRGFTNWGAKSDGVN